MKTLQSDLLKLFSRNEVQQTFVLEYDPLARRKQTHPVLSFVEVVVIVFATSLSFALTFAIHAPCDTSKSVPSSVANWGAHLKCCLFIKLLLSTWRSTLHSESLENAQIHFTTPKKSMNQPNTPRAAIARAKLCDKYLPLDLIHKNSHETKISSRYNSPYNRIHRAPGACNPLRHQFNCIYHGCVLCAIQTQKQCDFPKLLWLFDSMWRRRSGNAGSWEDETKGDALSPFTYTKNPPAPRRRIAVRLCRSGDERMAVWIESNLCCVWMDPPANVDREREGGPTVVGCMFCVFDSPFQSKGIQNALRTQQAHPQPCVHKQPDTYEYNWWPIIIGAGWLARTIWFDVPSQKRPLLFKRI